MTDISFLKLGLRQDGMSKHPIVALMIHSTVSLIMGGYLFWLASHMASTGLLSAERALGLTAWLLLLTAFQQHLKNQITVAEIEFFQQLPITAARILRIKMMQSVLPIFLPSLSILGIPLGWLDAVGETHQIFAFVVGLIGQYLTLMIFTMALSLYLGTENERSNTVFIARVGVMLAMGSVALLVILGPTFVGWVALIMKPLGYLFGTNLYAIALITTGLTSLLYLIGGLITSGLAIALSLKLSARLYASILNDAGPSASVALKKQVGLRLVPADRVLVTFMRKDLVNMLRSWRKHVPGLVSSFVLVSLMLVANLRSQTQASLPNRESVSMLVAIFTSFTVTGIGLVPSLGILAEDYPILGLIRMSGNLRRLVAGKILFAIGSTILLSAPFVGALALLFRGFAGTGLLVIMVAGASCLVTASAGVLITALRISRGVHPRYRDPVTPFLTYMASQIAAIGVVFLALVVGPVPTAFMMLVLPVVCLVAVLLAEELLGDVDIMA